ncbi:hypothetical protein BDV12DRAFT_203834 [Aspergillus spectabilis]
MTIVSLSDFSRPSHANRHLRVICAGAGASGLYLAYRLKHYFTDFTLAIYEKNHDIGGTWLENRYPGCACDVPAHNYTYSFEPKWDWSANYASAPEIFKYFSDFADKHGLRDYVHCNHKVVHAAWDEAAAEWVVQVEADGSRSEHRCDFFVNAAGILNSWRWPAIPGLHSFKGTLLHSADWDGSIDLTGKHVGLIGNGSSGIQILPQVQKVAKHVTTFIREPTWVSTAHSGGELRQYTKEEQKQFQTEPGKLLAMRKEEEAEMTAVFPMFVRDSESQKLAVQHIAQTMRQQINNEALADKLIPEFAMGCRRPTPGINYLESLTLENVTTVYGEITSVTPAGCVTEDGQEHPVDVLICATGFDTTFKPRFPVLGRSGDLAKQWSTDPASYLGLAAHGFPNYFMFLGPNCPVGVGPVIIVIEAQGCYITELMNRWQKQDIHSYDPREEAVREFNEHKDAFMQHTVWTTNCLSWYKNPATGKVTALWPGSTLHYLTALADQRYDDYEVKYNGNRFAYLGNGLAQLELDPRADRAFYVRDFDDGVSVLPHTTLSTFNVKDASQKFQVARGGMVREQHI